MNVTVCSAFRDSAGHLDRYLAQVDGLVSALNGRVDVVWGEGDSVDDTRARLEDAIEDIYGELVNVSHGGKYHGNIVHSQRFEQLAYVWGRIWARIPPESDAVLFVESDLIWDTETLVALIDGLTAYPAIAPMVYLQRTGYPLGTFYDVWAARKDGEHFAQHAPYCAGWPYRAPFAVDSMGSCLAIRGPLARRLTWPKVDVIVGVCAQIYRLGGAVYVDPALKVVHP